MNPRKILVLLLLVCPLVLHAAPFDAHRFASQLDAGALRISIPVDDGAVALDVERVTRNADGSVIVRARIDREGWAVLTSSGGRWYGNVHTSTRSFEIRDGAIVEDTAPVNELAPKPSVQHAMAKSQELRTTPIANAAPVVVDVLIFYTSRLASLVPLADITNIANAAVENANLAYERSGVSHRIRLAGLEQTEYNEAPPGGGLEVWEEARARMVNPADGFMDEMHTRRDALHADAVMLMIGRNDACGYATLMTATSKSKAFAPDAFGLTAIQCAAQQLTLAHELGHLMGLEHDRPARNPDFEPAFPYAFGYRHPEDKFRTIMATEFFCQQRCSRVPYFSNPDKREPNGELLGLPIDDPNAANNALALEQTMPIMATFREAALPAMLVRSFGADRTEIERGQSVTLSWNTENATTVTLTGIGAVAATGSITLQPLQSTTYTLTASQTGVASITSAVRVVVNCGGAPCAVPKRRAAKK